MTPDQNGVRLDRILAVLPEIGSRSQAARLIDSGAVTLNSKTCKSSLTVKTNDTYVIVLPDAEPSTIQPLKIDLDVVYEDSDLIVVNKPAGLVVHPAAGHRQDTLVNALVWHTDELSVGFNENRPGLVHRIDKDTSGLLVIAKNDEAQRFLAEQFKNKTTHRIYYAVSFGPLRNPHGTIKTYLSRHPVDRKRFASLKLIDQSSEPKNGKLAITHYQVNKVHASGVSLVQLKLETGRTHQIRVHLSELGSPIVGDSLYGADRRVKNLKSVALRTIITNMNRFALHAAELGFVHPRTKQNMLFKIDWPQDLLPLIEACGFL